MEVLSFDYHYYICVSIYFRKIHQDPELCEFGIYIVLFVVHCGKSLHKGLMLFRWWSGYFWLIWASTCFRDLTTFQTFMNCDYRLSFLAFRLSFSPTPSSSTTSQSSSAWPTPRKSGSKRLSTWERQPPFWFTAFWQWFAMLFTMRICSLTSCYRLIVKMLAEVFTHLFILLSAYPWWWPFR